MLVRKALLTDAPGLAKVHVDTWRTTYRGTVPDGYLLNLSYERSAKNAELMLSEGIYHYFLAEEAGTVVGFVTGGPNRGNEEGYDAELGAIYILKEAQGKGTGRALFLSLAEDLATAGFRSMILWVLEENRPARRFYEAMGGLLVSRKDIIIGGKTLVEVSYGWPDIRTPAR